MQPVKVPDQIAQVLRQEIVGQFKPGHRLPTVLQLAKRFDVSKHSITGALAILARDGLIEMWQGSGTYVREPTDDRHIGVVMELDFASPGTSYFWRRVAQQLPLFFQEHGYRVRLYTGCLDVRTPGEPPTSTTCRGLVEDVAQNKLCGVAVAWGAQFAEWVEPLQRRNVPIVGPAPYYEFGVMTDQVAILQAGARRLLEAGRRRIAFMEWDPTATDSWERGLAVRTLTDVMSQYGVTPNPRWLVHEIFPSLPGSGWEEFREIWSACPEKPDGLLVTDDMLFRDAVPAICELGIRVPEQLLIVATTNRGSGTYCPFPLMSMEYDPDEHARELGTLLLKRMHGETVAQPQVLLPFRWVTHGAAAAVQVAAQTK